MKRTLLAILLLIALATLAWLVIFPLWLALPLGVGTVITVVVLAWAIGRLEEWSEAREMRRQERRWKRGGR